MAQIRISLETPETIATGAFSMDFDPAFFSAIADVHMFSAAGDVIGTAAINGNHVDVQFSSPSGGVGRLPDLPIITVAIPVLRNAASGAAAAVTIDPGTSPWKDPNGARYDLTVQPGSVTAGESFSIQNVTPGGGLLPAGTVVRVAGSGFRPETAVEIPGVAFSGTIYVGPGEIDITLAGAAELTGRHVRARNPDGSIADYVSALLGMPLEPSATRIRPLFPLRTYSSINTGPIPRSLVGTRGIALENQNTTTVTVVVEEIDLFKNLTGRKTILLPPGAIFVEPDFAALGVQPSGFGGLLASLPIRAVSLSRFAPSRVTVASEVVQSYTKFLLPPLDISPNALSFKAQTGAPAPAPQTISTTLKINSFEAFVLSATASTTSGGAWLSATPAQGSTDRPFTAEVRVDPSRLAPGTYIGMITIASSSPDLRPATVPVSLTVGSLPSIDILTTSVTSFNLAPGAPAPPARTFSVTSSGNPAQIAIGAKTDRGGNWLSVAPATATTPAQIGFSVNPAGLPVGAYTGTITVQGPTNTQTLEVALTIALPPVVKLDSLSKTSLDLSFQAGAGSQAPTFMDSVTVLPLGAQFSVAASTDSGGNWLNATLSSIGPVALFNISVNGGSLTPGMYTGKVTVTSIDGASTLTLPVRLTIWSGTTPPLTVTPSALVLEGDTSAAPTQSFTVSSGGLPLQVKVSADIPPDSCTLVAIAGSPGTIQAVTPTTVTVSCGGGPGDYSGNITVTAGTSSVVVPVSIHIRPAPYSGPVTPPVPGAIVNAASGITGAVSPGEILTIHGSGVGTRDPAGISLDASGNIVRNPDGLTVLFDGIPAPLIYTSLFQTNLIVPYEIADRQITSIQVNSGGSLSGPITVPVAVSAPAIFTLDSSGVGRAAVLNQDNSVNDTSNPAARESVIQIYATGEGQTVPASITGSVTHSTKKPLLPVNATIGGVEAEVTYAGSAPEAVAGLFQVNVVVPKAAQTGPAIPLTLKIGDAQTQTRVTIAIR